VRDCNGSAVPAPESAPPRINRFVFFTWTSDACHCTLGHVIVSFKHQGIKRLYERGDRSKIGADLVNKIENILATLDAADSPQALDLPGYRLHPLKGSRKGFWAITVRANWRIIFRFENGDVWDVELLDYH
jgi:toxin HigB-1